VAIVVGMVVVLARRAAGWLLALALIGGETGAAQLAAYLNVQGFAPEVDVWSAAWGFALWVNVAQVALAVVCGITGLVLLLRLPRRSSPAAHG
jgi:hypothetical protein